MGENITQNRLNQILISDTTKTGQAAKATSPVQPTIMSDAEIKAKYNNLVTSSDSFSAGTKKPSLTSIQKHYYKIYNQAWKETGLPPQLMPKVVFKDLSTTKIIFGYSFPKGYIVIPKTEESLRKVTSWGKEKFIIAHECRHAKQLFNIARLYGSDKLKEILLNKSKSGNERQFLEDNFNKTLYDKVIKTMGKLDADSLEGKEAAKFAKALRKYNGGITISNKDKQASFINKLKVYAQYKKNKWKYKHNFLEIDANRAAQKFKPQSTKKKSLFNILKTILKSIKTKQIRL